MTLDIQLLDASFPSLTEVWAADPMLVAPNGVDALLSPQSVVSWPSQGQPTAQNQKLFNRVNGKAPVFLQMGTTSGADTTDPAWDATEQAFVFSKANQSTIRAVNAADLLYQSQSFLQIVWFKPRGNFFTQNNAFAGRWATNTNAAYILYAFSNSTTLAGFVCHDTSGTAGSGYDYITAPCSFTAGNNQVALAWQTNGSTATLSIYFNGAKVASKAVAFGTLYGGAPLFELGNSYDTVLQPDIFLKDFYSENLTISGNNPDARVALNYQKMQEILT